jgi:hypothetical protein
LLILYACLYTNCCKCITWAVRVYSMDTPCITRYEKWKDAIFVNIKEQFLEEIGLFFEKISVLWISLGVFSGFCQPEKKHVPCGWWVLSFLLGRKNNLPSPNLFLEVRISGDVEFFFICLLCTTLIRSSHKAATCFADRISFHSVIWWNPGRER